MPKVLVQLGRAGDILNILPLAEEANRQNNRVTLCVAEEFRGLLDGVSYVDPLFFQGSCDNVAEAVQRIENRGLPYVVSQLHGTDWKRQTESFLRDSWAKVGKEKRWEQLALRIDRRSREREDALTALVDWAKPVVLFAGQSISSPFANSESLRRKLEELCPEFSFVDLAGVRGERLFDLLGLFDRASALVSVDTAMLHLAKASHVPVVALVNPEPWKASLRTANHLLTRSYLEVDPEEIADALRRTLFRASRLVHVWQDWGMSPEDRRRNQQARASWCDEYTSFPKIWREIRVDCDAALTRSSLSIGETRAVPFVRDLLEIGLAETKRDSDVVVFTNSDVGFVPGLTEILSRNVAALGSAFSYRLNFDSAPNGKDRLAVNPGYWDGGLDLFAFSRKWLKERLQRMPDMLMGRPHWDLVYRHEVKKSGGSDLSNAIWHEKHESFWTVEKDTPGNRLNTELAREYIARNDFTRPYRETWRG